jgi:3-hydroxybutyryl-CoA dehydratase
MNKRWLWLLWADHVSVFSHHGRPTSNDNPLLPSQIFYWRLVLSMKNERGELAARIDFAVTAQQMTAFKSLSGDTNPVHDDHSYATARGFDGPIVYCGLIVAQIERLLGTEIPGPGCVCRWVSLKFRAPLYVGERASVEATILNVNEDLGLFDLKINVRCDGRSIAEGEAAAMLARERVTNYA